MVAGASAGLVGVGTEYTAVRAAAAADAKGPAWPTTVTAVAAASDKVYEDAVKAIATALDFKDADGKAAPKFTDAQAEVKKMVTQCEADDVIWTAAFKDTSDADKTLFTTNLKTAMANYADEVLGQCKKTGSTATDGTEFYAVDDKSDNKTACETADKPDKDDAGTSSAGTWEQAQTTEKNKTDTAKLIDDDDAATTAGTACEFKKGSAALASLEFWSGRVLTAAELEGLWPATKDTTKDTDTSATADGSASGTSPAYALAAGAAAAIALLL